MPVAGEPEPASWPTSVGHMVALKHMMLRAYPIGFGTPIACFLALLAIDEFLRPPQWLFPYAIAVSAVLCAIGAFAACRLYQSSMRREQDALPRVRISDDVLFVPTDEGQLQLCVDGLQVCCGWRPRNVTVTTSHFWIHAADKGSRAFIRASGSIPSNLAPAFEQNAPQPDFGPSVFIDTVHISEVWRELVSSGAEVVVFER